MTTGPDADPGADPGTVLDALSDADCRSILEATGDRPLTVAELERACDLPRSTLYRKVEELADAGLLDERVRMREQGPHPRAYVRSVAAVEVCFSASGTRVRLARDAGTGRASHPAEHADTPGIGSGPVRLEALAVSDLAMGRSVDDAIDSD
jgi:DNA-binding transcriptional ArsR family regulator